MIEDVVRQYLPIKRKMTPSGWESFNCVACHHNGHKPDTRSRGGIKFSPNGYSYHCFNCGFKTRWENGSYLGKNNVEFMKYLGVPDNVIGRCKIDAMGHSHDENDEDDAPEEPRIYNLPKSAKSFSSLIEQNCTNRKFLRVLEYVGTRNIKLLDWYDFYWADEKENDMSNRFIIPVYSNGNIVGYNARSIGKSKVKYLAQVNKSIVFNSELLYNNRKYCTIVEGPLDAISISGTATMSNDPTDGQIQQYNSSKQLKVVVPDNDKAGRNMIEIAIDNGWYVSFPKWDVNDCAEAVEKYGRTSTLIHIFDNIEKSPLKIQIKAKRIGESINDKTVRFGTPRPFYNNDAVRT